MNKNVFTKTIFAFIFSFLAVSGFSQTLTYVNDVPFGTAQNFITTNLGVYYIGSNNVSNNLVEKIYRTNGFSNGNLEVTFNTSNSTRLTGLIEINSNGYFIAKNNATNNIEIWKLDASGAILVDQLNSSISAVSKVVPQNGQIYFVCTTSTTQNGSNQAIFRTSGTTGSTKLATYIPITNLTTSSNVLLYVGNNVYLISNQQSNGSVVYQTLIDEIGTQKIIQKYAAGFCGNNLLTFAGDTLFSETISSTPTVIKTDHTVPLFEPIQQSNFLYFMSNNAGIINFWRMDGTVAGAKKLASDASGLSNFTPDITTEPVFSNGNLYFHDYVNSAYRIWKVGLTDVALTHVADLPSPQGIAFSKMIVGDSIYATSSVYFSATNVPNYLYQLKNGQFSSLGQILNFSPTLPNGKLYGYTNGGLLLNTSGFTTSPNQKLGLWKLQISAPTIPFDTFLTVKNSVLDTFHNDINTCFACTATGTSYGWEIYKHTNDKDSVLIKKGIPIYQGDYANAEIVSRIVNGNRWIIRTNNTFSPATSTSERNYCYFSTDLSGNGISVGLCQYFIPTSSSTGKPNFGKSFTTLDSFYYEDPYNRNSQTNGSRFFRTNGLTWDEIPFIPTAIDTTKPDLIIVANIINSLLSGQKFGINATIVNNGINTAYSPYTVNLYLSRDAVLSPDDRLISKVNITSNLAAGANFNPVLNFQVPNDVTAGSYYFILKVDGDDQIVESNENNNLVISPATITNPNLTAKLSANPALSDLANVTKGSFINLNYDRSSWATGAVRTDTFGVRFYFSKDTLFSADDYNIVALKDSFGGTTTTGSLYFSTALVPASFASGTYYIVEDVDYNQNVLESSETDNKSYLRVNWVSGVVANPCDTDRVAPVIANCPVNTVKTVSDSTQCATVTWTEPTATDNCGTPSIVRTGFASGSCFKPGINAVSYTATDAKGNKTTCAFTVAVSVTSVVTGTYCASKANLPWSEWIAGVQIANLNNVSSKEGYGNFTNLTATVQSGTSYPFTLTPGFSWAGDPNNATLQWRVWIDFNKNGVFDSTELVASGNRNNFTASVAIPINAIGATRMRVSMKTIGAPTACEVFDKGEVEDYNITIGSVTVDPCLSDTTKPIFTNCPANIVQTVSDSTKCAVVTWTAPTSTDNCTASPTITQTGLASGSCFTPKAVSTILYTATDAKGNKSTCTFTVTVNVSAVVATSYCASKGNLPWSEWISQVQFANISNASSKEGYGDFTSQVATVKTGTSYPITVTPSFSWAADPSNAPLIWNVWIDYDNNKVFDASELVASGTRTTSTANILIPTTAKVGTTRMRISMKTIGTPTACEVFDRGEVEDYSVSITSSGANPCLTDTIAPVFTNCPANIITTYSEPATCAIVTWTEPTATDNCTTPTILKTSTALNGGCYTGVYTHTYTATDAKGNKATCAFNITATQSVVTASPVTMSLVANPTTYKQYTTLTYTLSVKNTGAALSNVVITFKKPNQTNAGGTKTPSVGVFNDYCPGGIECSQWIIPTLAANSTATLVAPFFVLGGSAPIIATASLTSSTPSITVSDATLSISPSLALIGQKNILALSAQSDFNKVQLTWLSNLGNVDYFEIQRADKQNDFQKIGSQSGCRDKPCLVSTYNFTDIPLNEGAYNYRIKLVQLDGSELFSDIRQVKIVNLNSLIVFPNPATDELSVSLKNYVASDVQVLLYSSLGIIVKNVSTNTSNDTILKMDVSELPTGTYLVRVVSKGKRDATMSFIVTH